jgi:hypothetical protein
MAEKTLVIYHGNCVDGLTSFWLARRNLPGDVEEHAAKYGDPPPRHGRKTCLYLGLLLSRGSYRAHC